MDMDMGSSTTGMPDGMSMNSSTTMKMDGSTKMHMGGSKTMGDMSGMDMNTYFVTYWQNQVVLFQNWILNSPTAFWLSVIGIFCLAILYEGIKYFREHLMNLDLKESQLLLPQGSTSSTEALTAKRKVSFKQSMFSKYHVIQTMLHFLQTVLSYFLMLIVMTFNVWLFLAVVIGDAVGYFSFGWYRKSVLNITDHCH